MVGEFVRGDRDAWVIATEFTDAPPGNDANRAGNGRKSLVRAVERPAPQHRPRLACERLSGRIGRRICD
jgi:hypothetical protein